MVLWQRLTSYRPLNGPHGAGHRVQLALFIVDKAIGSSLAHVRGIAEYRLYAASAPQVGYLPIAAGVDLRGSAYPIRF